MKIPPHLPTPPDPPEGHFWAYRGKGWASTERAPYAMIGESDTEWFAVSHPMLTLGAAELHYLEAVPTLATTDPIEAECHVQPIASMSTLPKLPRGFRLPKGLHDRVSEIYQDDDGWWCDFAEGWVWNGQTGVREDTKSRLIATIRDAAKGEEF